MTKAPTAEVRGTGYVRTLAHGPAEFGLVHGGWSEGAAAVELTPLGEAPTQEAAWEALRERWKRAPERVVSKRRRKPS